MILISTLNLFNRYADWLEEQFNDGLMVICYGGQTKAIFKILYGPTISEDAIREKIPQAWEKAQNKGKIEIIIKKYSNDSEEVLKSKKN